jgi:hypothetical protein
MPRSLAAFLGAFVVLGACGGPTPSLPLEDAVGGPSAPDDGSPSSESGATGSGNISCKGGVIESIADAGAHDTTGDALDGADATSAALDVSVAADEGRVSYRAIAVATGQAHTCALLDDHRVKCWGDNSYGQLGYGDTRARGGSPSEMGDALPTVDLGSGRTATAIAASRHSTCAILDDGSVKCWGFELTGSASMNKIGDQPGEMGDHLLALNFCGRRAVSVGMGWRVGCAAMDDDTIWCWGGGQGPGGTGTPWEQIGLPAKPVRALGQCSNGAVALYGDGTLSTYLPLPSILDGSVPLTPVFTSDHKAVAVAGGVYTGTCALLDDGTTACGMDGQAREGPANVIAIGVEHTGGGLCLVLSVGSIRCEQQDCNRPTYYQCSSDGSIDLGVPAVAVTSNGDDFACALLADGNIKCWSYMGNTNLPPAPWLGASIDFTQTSAGVTYGAWNTVDLGTHP